MDWRTSYPCLAAVMAAGMPTLQAWEEHLPAPQTDVERTVLRRLRARMNELASVEIRRVAPDIADQFNAILDRMDRLGIPIPDSVERM